MLYLCIELYSGSNVKETKLSSSLSLKNVIFLALTVILLSAGQVLVKAGIQKAAMPVSENFFGRLFPLLLQPLVLGGLLATATSTAFYFTVLSEINLSIAYPFISFSYVVVLILSSIIFGEHISITQIIGIFLILLGVLFMSRPN